MIDDKYVIQGILQEKQFYLNPKWQGKVYYTDNLVVLPMVYSLQEWGGDIINQLHILEFAPEKEMKIKAEIEKYNMEEQITYIKNDVANYVR